jgi:hypothetical protein
MRFEASTPVSSSNNSANSSPSPAWITGSSVWTAWAADTGSSSTSRSSAWIRNISTHTVTPIGSQNSTPASSSRRRVERLGFEPVGTGRAVTGTLKPS